MAVLNAYCDRDVWGLAAAGNGTDAQLQVIANSKYPQSAALHFPISLPAGSTISQVLLWYYYLSASGWVAGETSTVSECVSDWTETPGGEVLTAGTTYDFLAALRPAAVGWTWISSATLTAMVQAWFAGTLVNRGLMLAPAGGTVDDGDAIAIASRQSGNVPYLAITYSTNPNTPAWGATPTNGASYDATVPYVVTGSDPDGDVVIVDIDRSTDGVTWTNVLTGGSKTGNLDSSAWPGGSNYRLRARFRDPSGNASVYAVNSGNLFTISHTSHIKVRIAGAWVLKPLKRWNGTAWVGTKLKRWTGSVWTQVT